MKARVKTRRDIEYQLQRKEIERINKLWLFALHQCFEFGNVRLRKIYQEICDISEKAYNMPEIWYYIDELLIDNYSMDFFEPENLQEREKTVKQIHKENGKKWRDY